MRGFEDWQCFSAQFLLLEKPWSNSVFHSKNEAPEPHYKFYFSLHIPQQQTTESNADGVQAGGVKEQKKCDETLMKRTSSCLSGHKHLQKTLTGQTLRQNANT